MEYPQATRSAWADAYAKKCSAIWAVVDARQRALAHPQAAKRAEAEAQLPALIAAKEAAIQTALAARRALDQAEAAFYGVTE